ncbi:MAG: hypothetical protein JSV95_13265 [Gemmatimonadota bacterium]|jgi:hypothetical protein|nr:MAG: hypothetical protein JSV95_13265 [Gemmatimonadota bacterium]
MSSHLPVPATTSRWELVRDALVFQGKLFVDGLRDAAMIPLSIVAAVMDLLGIGARAGRNFYDVVLFGRQTERWINLFSAADRLLPEGTADSPPSGLDVLLQRLEDMVVEEYQRGGITTSAKAAVDRALDNLQRPERR